MYMPHEVHQRLSLGEQLNKYFGRYLTSAQARMGCCRGCRRIQSERILVCCTIKVSMRLIASTSGHVPKLDGLATQCIHLRRWKYPNAIRKEDDNRGSGIWRVKIVRDLKVPSLTSLCSNSSPSSAGPRERSRRSHCCG